MRPVMLCVAFVAMCVLFLIYQRIKREGRYSLRLQIAFKCAATFMAVLAALAGCLEKGAPSGWVLLAGLTACTVADGVLCVSLIPGGAIFALGHVLYMISFCLMRGPDWRSAAVFLCLMAMVTAGFFRFRERLGRNALLACAYAAVLSLMVSLAAVQAPLLFAGALLFACSDALLAYLLVNGGSRELDYASLGMYYLGQFLLALGCAL